MQLKFIDRYPVKSLHGEALSTVGLAAGQGLPFDRTFAITHQRSKYNASQAEWLPRRNFSVLSRSPKLAQLAAGVDEQSGSLQLRLNGSNWLDFPLSTRITRLPDQPLAQLCAASQPPDYHLVSASGASLWDAPSHWVSVINTASLDELSSAVGQSLPHRRFRCNLCLETDKPWQEFDWIGSEICIGDTVLEVVDRIVRCIVINRDPHSGEEDLSLTRHLFDHYAHCDFGVHCEVKRAGVINVGDQASLRALEKSKGEQRFGKLPFC